jgi:uncharacterized protein YecE (DUF72 family)
MSRIWIGTSGWTYDGWRGPFYPPEVRKKDNDQKSAAPLDTQRLRDLLMPR